MSGASTRVWVGLFVLVVFVAGLAAGVTVGPWISQGPPRGFRPAAPPGGPPPPRMTERLLDRIAADLDLTVEQDRQLRDVFETRRRRLRAINQEVRGRFEAEQAQMNAEIAVILTPEQMTVFDEIVRMRQDRRGPRGRGEPQGGPPFGPERGPGPP